MNIIFFEVQDWEREGIRNAFPDAKILVEPLTQENASLYSNAEIISIFVHSTITEECLNALPQLRYITTRSTGYDHINLPACTQKNVIVANVPEYGSNTVAEHTFALLLSLTRKIPQAIQQAKTLGFDHKQLIGIDLKNKTIGIIGLGKIGMEVLRIAKGFGMQVLVYSHTQKSELQEQYGFTYVQLDDLLKNADIITLHIPLTAENHHLINKENILLLKKGSYLINTARGGLIDTEAIILGLEKEILEGVGLDVLEEENQLDEEASLLLSGQNQPIDFKTLLYDHVLLNHPKVLITPHNAFNSKEAIQRILDTTIENVHMFIAGTPQNIVTQK